MDQNTNETIEYIAVRHILGYGEEVPVIEKPEDPNYPAADLQKSAKEGNLGAIRLVAAAFTRVREYGLATVYYELGCAQNDETCMANAVICGAQLVPHIRTDLERYDIRDVIAMFMELMGLAQLIVDPNPQVRGSARFIKLEWAAAQYLFCMINPTDGRCGEMLELAEMLFDGCSKDLEPEYCYYYACVLEARYMQQNHTMDHRFERRYFNLLEGVAEQADTYSVGPAACADLAGAYLYGIGTNKNEDKAYQWFKKANDMGMNLGHVLNSFRRNGKGKYELK